MQLGSKELIVEILKMTNKNGTILVTGGSRGIGAQTVILLAQQGYDVCFTYLKHIDAAQQVLDKVHNIGRRAWAIQIDAADLSASSNILSKIPNEASPLVGLVNNVGITSKISAFTEIDLQTMQHVFDVNVLGVFALTQTITKKWLQENQKGVIVNVSSVAAKTGSPGEYVHYAASKSAIETFTVGLGKELATKGIRVNCVSPGICLTEIHALSGEPDRAHRLAPRIPMGRAGDAKEIAQSIAWLISDQASYITATILPVSGGI